MKRNSKWFSKLSCVLFSFEKIYHAINLGEHFYFCFLQDPLCSLYYGRLLVTSKATFRILAVAIQDQRKGERSLVIQHRIVVPADTLGQWMDIDTTAFAGTRRLVPDEPITGLRTPKGEVRLAYRHDWYSFERRPGTLLRIAPSGLVSLTLMTQNHIGQLRPPRRVASGQ